MFSLAIMMKEMNTAFMETYEVAYRPNTKRKALFGKFELPGIRCRWKIHDGQALKTIEDSTAFDWVFYWRMQTFSCGGNGLGWREGPKLMAFFGFLGSSVVCSKEKKSTFYRLNSFLKFFSCWLRTWAKKTSQNLSRFLSSITEVTGGFCLVFSHFDY